jgi:hypothetical protein
MVNASGLMARYQPRSWERLSDGTLLFEERAFDPRTGRVVNTWTFIGEDAVRREHSFTHRLSTSLELEAIMGRASL